MFKDHLFGLGVLYLIFVYDVLFVNGLHSEKFLRVFLLNEENSAESPLTKHDLGNEIINTHLFFTVVVRVQSLCCLTYQLLLLLLALDMLLKRYVVMQDRLSTYLFCLLVFLLVFCCGVMDQIQLIPVVDGHLFVERLPIGL